MTFLRKKVNKKSKIASPKLIKKKCIFGIILKIFTVSFILKFATKRILLFVVY